MLTVYDLYKWRRPRLYLLGSLPLLGTVIYLLLNYVVGGDWFSFVASQKQVWYQEPQIIFRTFGAQQDFIQTIHFNNFFNNNEDNYFLYRLAMWGSQVFFLGQALLLLIYAVWRKIDWRYLTFSLAYLIMSFSISNPMSGTRFIFALWPLHTFLALFLERRPIMKAAYIVFSIALLVLFLGVYAYTFSVIV
jgi:hypothetical protein